MENPGLAVNRDAELSRDRLRTLLRKRRLAVPAGERMAAAEALAHRLRQLPELNGPAYVAGYWAVQGEISLHAVLSPRPPFVYCLPCLAPGKHLRFAAWRFGDALVQNRYGIPEPELEPALQRSQNALDVVLVPLVGFDARGHRLGAGGGYYDRSFAFLKAVERPARPRLIGVAYDFQEVEALQVEAWDVAMDAVVTPTRTLLCR